MSWALVEFKNAYQTRDKFEKVSAEELDSVAPDWKPETQEDCYSKEVLLEVGDWIIWKEERVRIIGDNGELMMSPGMKGQVIGVRDGCPPRLEAPGEPSFPWALVEFKNGVVATVDPEIRFVNYSSLSWLISLATSIEASLPIAPR
jgi:hypothetical protein